MIFTAKVQGPDGPQEFAIELNPQQTVGDARQQLQQRGFQLVDLIPRQQLPTTATTTATSTRGISPADIGQAAGGGIGMMLGGPAAAIPLALGARGLLTERVPARAGSRELQPLGQSVARGVRQGLPGEALALLTSGAMTAGRAAKSVVAPRALPALRELTRTIGPAAGRQEVTQALGREAAEGSRLATEGLRQTVSQVFSDRMTGPIALKKGLQGLFTRMTDKTLQHTVFQKVFDATKINLQTTTARELARMVEREPERVVHAIRIFEAEAGINGEPLLRTVRQSVVSRAARRSVRPPPTSVFSRAGQGGILDRESLVTELKAMRKKLGEDGMHAVFGPEHVRELDSLSQRLGRRRLLTEFARPGEPKPALDPPIRLLPFALAFTAGQMLGGRMGEIIEIASGVSMLRDMRTLVPVLLSTKAGTRLIAAGIEMQQRGAPDRMIVPVLARLVPAVLSEIQGARSSPEMSPGVSGAFVGGPPSL